MCVCVINFCVQYAWFCKCKLRDVRTQNMICVWCVRMKTRECITMSVWKQTCVCATKCVHEIRCVDNKLRADRDLDSYFCL